MLPCGCTLQHLDASIFCFPRGTLVTRSRQLAQPRGTPDRKTRAQRNKRKPPKKRRERRISFSGEPMLRDRGSRHSQGALRAEKQKNLRPAQQGETSEEEAGRQEQQRKGRGQTGLKQARQGEERLRRKRQSSQRPWPCPCPSRLTGLPSDLCVLRPGFLAPAHFCALCPWVDLLCSVAVSRPLAALTLPSQVPSPPPSFPLPCSKKANSTVPALSPVR